MKYLLYILLLSTSLAIISCGGNDKSPQSEKEDQAGGGGSLTAFQLENGIGPVTEKILLGDIDPVKVKNGEALFIAKCAPCHKLDKRLVGPALRYVTKRRSPEYILNMILNPTGMVKDHPEAKKVLGEYLSPMTNMNLTLDQAKELLDYLRSTKKEGDEKNIPEVPLFRSSQQ